MTLPNFLIIGAQRSSTTSLYLCLAQHPQIFMSRPKEPHFFLGEDLKPWQYYPGQRVRLWHDRVTRLVEYERLFEGANACKAIGEASVWYLHRPEAALRIRRHLPAVKLIAILRDPVDRCFSDFKQGLTLGYEHELVFSDALLADERRIRERTGSACYYVEQGFYHRFLQHYLSLFDREQLRIYLYEDLKHRPTEMLRDLLDFLGVDVSYAESMGVRRVNASPENYKLLGLKSKALGWLPGLPSRVIVPTYALPASADVVRSRGTGLRGFFRETYRSGRKAAIEPRYRRIAIAQLLERIGLMCSAAVKPVLENSVRRQLLDIYREDTLRLADLLQRDLSHWRKG